MTKMNSTLAKAIDKALNAQKGMRVNGRPARGKTDIKHAEVVRAAFSRINALGFGITDPANVSQKHLKELVNDWFRRKLANKTMQNNRSRLSIFFARIGKGNNFFRPLHEYLEGVDPNQLKVSAVAASK